MFPNFKSAASVVLIAAVVATGVTLHAQPDIPGLIQTLSSSRDVNQRIAAAHALGQVALIFGADLASPAV